MNEMMHRKKLLKNLPELYDSIETAFAGSNVCDTVWMKNGNSTLFEEIQYCIKKWIEEN